MLSERLQTDRSNKLYCNFPVFGMTVGFPEWRLLSNLIFFTKKMQRCYLSDAAWQQPGSHQKRPGPWYSLTHSCGLQMSLNASSHHIKTAFQATDSWTLPPLEHLSVPTNHNRDTNSGAVLQPGERPLSVTLLPTRQWIVLFPKPSCQSEWLMGEKYSEPPKQREAYGERDSGGWDPNSCEISSAPPRKLEFWHTVAFQEGHFKDPFYYRIVPQCSKTEGQISTGHETMAALTQCFILHSYCAIK